MSKKIFMILITISIITSYTLNNSIYVYASEDTVSYDSLSAYEKICVYLYYGLAEAGEIVSLDFNEAEDIHNEWVEFVNGTTYEKKLSEMTESEIQEILDNLMENLESKGCNCDSNGNVTMSDDFIKEFRSWLDTYMKDNTTPLYYMVHVSNFSDLKASNCNNTYSYYTIKNAIEKYGVIATRYYNGKLYIYDLSDFENNYFLLHYTYLMNSNGNKMYTAEPYFKSNENHATVHYIAIDFADDTTPLTDFENDYRITSSSNVSVNLKLNSIDYYNSFTTNWNIGDSQYQHIFSKNDMYVKSFTSLANYQNYITSTAEQKIYYTSNYFKTENIQQSPIGLDEMVKLYEAYDDLCKKIIQYVQDTQNATDTMIVNKLDELIKAVYATGGTGGNTDVDVNVDMTETNNILTKILEAIKNIRSDTYIDYGDSTVNTDWANIITNMVVQPEININTTIGNMSDAFTNSTSMLKKKFPFSIPWDIAFLLEFLADTPTTPKFEIPFTIESMDVHETVVIDLENFEAVSKVSRMLLTILYMVALMQLTTKMVIVGKEQ